MKLLGVEPSEHTSPQRFWAKVREALGAEALRLEAEEKNEIPCECTEG